MRPDMFEFEELSVNPGTVFLYVPPIVWKGDSIGHIGQKDLFFWVIEGECFLRIDNQNYIIRPGQLAFLPKGKMRAYTHASPRFSMYEMGFEAKANGHDLMSILGLTEDNFVVDIPQKELMSSLFENSHRKELYKNPLYDVTWCANILNIIQMYANEHKKISASTNATFRKVLEYMSKNIDGAVTINELASIACMQSTYFVKRFRETYGIPPLVYYNRMKIYKSMGLLAGTDLSIEQIAKSVGVSDASYFSRMFKKYCNLTPTEYRAEFNRNY